MNSLSRVPRLFALGLPMVIVAFALSACGSFDSAASGEHLIKDYVSKFGQGKVTVTSVKCPSGVKQVTGKTYDCQVKLHDKPSNNDGTGSITIHMAAGNKVVIEGKQDLHLQ